jgi:hypothetical protein
MLCGILYLTSSESLHNINAIRGHLNGVFHKSPVLGNTNRVLRKYFTLECADGKPVISGLLPRFSKSFSLATCLIVVLKAKRVQIGFPSLALSLKTFSGPTPLHCAGVS